MKNHLKPGLYIVSTPIGNLDDMTIRAVNTLKSSDIILCEDTRVTKKLLEHFVINAPLRLYNEHSDDFMRNKILEMIKEDKIISLVSDAGTPLISDPGYKLVKMLQDEGCFIDIAPGVSSTIAALTLSGLPTDKFSFLGFIPKTSKQKFFQQALEYKSTLIFFETAKRIISSLEAALEILGNREAAIAREITKLYQESNRAPISELIEYYTNKPPKGEIVFLISGEQNNEDISEEEILSELIILRKNLSSKDATEKLFTQISNKTELKKKDIYKLASQIKIP